MESRFSITQVSWRTSSTERKYIPHHTHANLGLTCISSRHLSTVIGKAISTLFYTKPIKKSYYLGCSTGGRQGFKAAQDFPYDFDGIVAGAPALAFNNLTSWSGHFYNLTGPPGSPTFLPPNLWVTVHLDVLKQCDALDGLIDGIIEDPRICSYDPSGLLCTGTNTENCLTLTQIQTV